MTDVETTIAKLPVETLDLASDMTAAYMGYARATITDRALPDVRDGLKPVQRRILYAMHELGLTAGKPHKKSARIVGEVLGKYHPHGDTSVYHTLVRMGQDFSMEIPLVDGQGNFGSVDGDSPAAMRYTEARLTAVAETMLQDLDMETVDWQENFDGSLEEPTVLPTVFPNLLVNGSAGIAVGMSTNMPPHNLAEVCDALIYVAENWKKRDRITTEDLLKFIPGPDFPTGGILYRYRDRGDGLIDTVYEAYETGRGRIVTQARVLVEDIGGGKSNLVITELPYNVQKNTVMEKIAKEIHRGRVTGVTDLRDESDYTGMRLVIEVSRTGDPEEVLEQVLKYSQLRETFGVINLALVPYEEDEAASAPSDGDNSRPTYLSLHDLLTYFLSHRLEVIERRSKHELENRAARLHIVEGLLTALDVLDEVIDTIRSSREPRTARNNLMRQFRFSEAQADAILHTQLQQLAALGRTQLKDEEKELRARIGSLERLLASEKRRLDVVVEETRTLRDEFGVPRRTVIVDSEDKAAGTTVMTGSDLVTPEGDQVLALTPDGIERCDVSDFSHRPSDGLTTRSARSVHLAHVQAKPDDQVILLSSGGKGWLGKVGFIPQEATPEALGLRGSERIIGISVVRRGQFLVLGTQEGRVKRTALEDLGLLEREWGPVIGLSGDDVLLFGDLASENADVIFYTQEGQLLRLASQDINPQKTDTASGVIGVSLQKGDGVLGGAVVERGGPGTDGDPWHVVVVSETGYANRVPLDDFTIQGRNTQGMQCLRETKTGGKLGDVAIGKLGDALDVYLEDGRRFHTGDIAVISAMTRGSRGKRLFDAGGSRVMRAVAL
ncbi:MAG: DNA topoisomerase 4 subunit A [Anaerolineae bacterium]|jgi:DNA gyrase subunit A